MPTVFTIGHSTRTQDELIALLKQHGVTVLADVRKMPRSRANPQFNADTLAPALAAAGIRYVYLPGLGGLRRPRPDSVNTAWRNRSFQGYADYMQTPEFREALDELLALASQETVSIMCAEAVPWRCHRSLIADALVARGQPVVDILGAGRADPHALRAFARVEDGRVYYPATA